jgi:hypothetical protein
VSGYYTALAAQHHGHQDLVECRVSCTAVLRRILGNEGPGGTDWFVLVGRKTGSPWLMLEIASSPRPPWPNAHAPRC